MTKNRGLGRGLSSLISTQSPTIDKNVETADNKTFLPINQISAGKYQPRKQFSEENLQELADSIKLKGVIQPIIVRDKDEDGKYQIIAGERRWRASKLAGLETIPTIIKDITDSEALEIGLIENIQRQDLNPIEEALGYQKLIEEFKYSQAELSKMLSKSRSHIANLLRLLSLPKQIIDMVNEGKITMGHARALVNYPKAIELADRIISESLSVRKVEQIIKKDLAKESEELLKKLDESYKEIDRSINELIGKGSKKKKETDVPKSEDLKILEQAISANIGSIVTIEDDTKGGKVTIFFDSLEQLDKILQRLTA